MPGIYRTGTLHDGTDPATLGTRIRYDEDPEQYERLVDEIERCEDHQLLAWFAAPGTGSLIRTDAERRREWKLPDDCAALVEWNDGDPKDPETQLVMLTEIELDRILADNECTAVDTVTDHYEGRPDDGHPAYRLREIRDRRVRAYEENDIPE